MTNPNLSLRPYSLTPKFVFGLHDLVKKNESELAVDFPAVPGRYKTVIDAARSVRRAIENPDVDPYAIQVDAHSKLISEARATYRQILLGRGESGNAFWVKQKAELAGVATLIAEDEDDGAVYGAWWIDKDQQRAGIATFAATSLVETARARGLERFNAYVRPENEASTSIVEELGFKAVGKAAAVDLGDGVKAPRQKFSLELEQISLDI